MASRIDIPISYSPGSIDQILKDFDAIIKQADISDVFAKDQDKIRAQFANIAATIKEQLASGKIDLTKVNFTGLEKDIEDFARKVAFVLNEAFEKEVEPYAKKITSITDQIVVKQKEIADLNQQMADITGKERDDFKQKYGLSRMPPLDKGEAKRRLAGAEKELEADQGNVDLQKKVEMYRELLEMLSTEKQRKKEIKDQISKKEVEVLDLTNEKKRVQIDLDKAQAKLGADAANYSQQLLDLNRLLIVAKENGIQLSAEQIKLLKEQADATEKNTSAGNREQKGLIARAGATFSYGLILGQLRKVYQQSLKTVIELDKAMTEAAIVTEMNREEAYKLLGAYQQLARDTGLATSEISGIVVEFLKQGRTMAEAMELAKVAAMSAKVAGIDAREAVDYLTSAVNGFGLAADKAKDIADKFSAIAAASATDFEELAIAMSKVAPVAKTAGVGVDFMMGVLAKGLETTREAPENIGTAFKTIFARMREVTDIGKATEDGMSLNRVEKALQSIGVPLRDTTGQFRNLEQVLIDVGNKWDTLTTIEQAYIATALAGTRQQPRLLAIFNDFARTKELIQISSDAVGQLAFQHMEYMDGAAAALSQLKTAWEGFIMAFTDTEMVIGAIQLLTDSVNVVTGIFKSFGDSTALNTTALVGLALAFGALAPSMILNITNMLVQSVLSANMSKLTDEETRELRELNNEYRTANAVRRQSIINRKQEILANHATAFSFKSLIAATLAHIKVMLIQAAVAGLVTLAIAALGFGLTYIVSLFKSEAEAIKEVSDAIGQNNKQLDELSQSEKNVSKLVTRFDELSRKIVKTTEELDEMKRIAEELSEVKIGEQTFTLSRTDITGNVVLDKTQYENFLAAIENERQDLLEKNQELFSKAVDNKTLNQIINALKDPVILNTAKAIGYDFGITYINSMTDSFSEKNISEAMDNLKRAMSRISGTFFVDMLNVDYSSITGTYASAVNNVEELTQKAQLMLDSLLKEGITGATQSERYTNALNYLKEANLLSADMFKDSATAAEDINVILIKLANTFSNATFYFDEEKAQEFGAEMAQLFLEASEQIDNALLGVEGTTSDLLDARLDAYRTAIDKINEEYGLGSTQAEVRISILQESMQDEAIMDILQGKGLKFDAIVNFVDKGNSLSELGDLYDEFVKRQGSEEEARTFTRSLNSAFGETNDLLTNVGSAYKYINYIFGEGTADAAYFINQLSESLNFLNSTTAAAKLTEQGKGIQDLLKLPEQIAKGDFSKYSDLVADYGFDTVNALLQGNFSALDPFFNKEKANFEKQIRDAQNNIERTYYAINTSAFELGAAEKEQIAQLELMLDYYDKIAGVEQFRAVKVKEVKQLLKETNDLYALQEKLSKGGMSADNPFMKLLDKLTTASESEALSKLGAQLQSDINKLNSLGKFVDGQFVRDSNVNINETELATKNMMETLTQLIDVQTSAYNKQAKVIEERYKTELDAMKSAHDEKWSQIDYNNKLLETEEKIIDARRQLMGLALSGAMRGEYKDAQKALENLQREREKTIETQMLDDAQKQLEQQRNDDLIKAQTEFTKAIEGYTNTIEGLAPLIVPESRPRVTPEDIAIEFDGTKQSLDILTNTLDQLNMDSILQNQKTGELIDVNTLMIDQMADLIATIENWKIKIGTTISPSGVDTDGLGT